MSAAKTHAKLNAGSEIGKAKTMENILKNAIAKGLVEGSKSLTGAMSQISSLVFQQPLNLVKK